MKNIVLFTCLLLIFQVAFTQEKLKKHTLDSIVITSSRIDIPFQKKSKTIILITSKQIQKSTATSLVDLLQQSAGIDIRQRGVKGMQADLYIRGGSFDQTLLLIDGIKTEDPQTGHHTLNIALPLEVIERIEIIKGPAARIYGQNAFNGAINIVTKKSYKNNLKLRAESGSFGQTNAGVTFGQNLKKTSLLAHFSKNSSDGYRFNTDFDNNNYFLKATFNKNKFPIDMIATLSERKFGANGFYASPLFINQYEETQASLLGFSTTYKIGKTTLKPRLYWKRNQDMYVFLRENPSVFRNLHISNKIGAEINVSYTSNFGVTGFGVDIAKIWLSSNNLGNRNRTMTTVFVEHQFKILNNSLDITPGIAVNYFSDFKFHAFPGIDVGYQLNSLTRMYVNSGYTYRIPTYTDLYYTSPTTIGDENLQPEQAFTNEIGFTYKKNKIDFSVVVFQRDASNVIDYVKQNEADKWKATNIQKITTLGIELTSSFGFSMNNYPQNIQWGYTYLNEKLKQNTVNFSRYVVNSLKHHVTVNYSSQFFKKISQSISYKFAERLNGENYQVLDAKISFLYKEISFTAHVNNILDEIYTETNLVPMPKRNFLIGMQFSF